MSPVGKAEALAHLRSAIAGIATPGGSGETRAPAKLPLTPRLDAWLGGGLAGDALHEIIPAAPGDGAAAMGFGLALAARFLEAPRSRAMIIGEDFATREGGALYGPGLIAHGLELGRLAFVNAPDARSFLWAMEEALKSGGLGVVLGELWSRKAYSLAASRRLALAARAGRTPALLVMAASFGAAQNISSAAATRFEAASAPSAPIKAASGRDLPGPPAFALRLVKARLGAQAQAFQAQAFQAQAFQAQAFQAQAPPQAFDPEKIFSLQWNAQVRHFEENYRERPFYLDLVDASGQRSRA